MAHIIAQGAPGSTIRKLQENPQLAYRLLKDAKAVIAQLGWNASYTIKDMYYTCKEIEGKNDLSNGVPMEEKKTDI